MPIKLKNSQVTGRIPVADDLVIGEVALNTADGKLYTKHSDESIKLISPSKTDLNLNNVDNTTDLLKPTSTATQAALDLKASLISAVLVSPELGTPTSGILTNCTGTATSLTVGIANNIAGGTTGQVLYQSNIGVTSFVSSGSAGQYLTSNGADAPTWSSITGSGAAINDDTTADTVQYLGMSRIITGAWTTAYTASTKLFFTPATGILNATIFQSLSDVTQKTNVQPITDAVATIAKIDGVEFDWIDNNKKSAGVIAQQLELVLPHLVETTTDGLKSVNYSGMIGYLIEAIKELSVKVSQLEDK